MFSNVVQVESSTVLFICVGLSIGTFKTNLELVFAIKNSVFHGERGWERNIFKCRKSL